MIGFMTLLFILLFCGVTYILVKLIEITKRFEEFDSICNYHKDFWFEHENRLDFHDTLLNAYDADLDKLYENITDLNSRYDLLVTDLIHRLYRPDSVKEEDAS